MKKTKIIESSFTRVGTAISDRLHKLVMWFFQQLLRYFPEKYILTTDRHGIEWFVIFKRLRGRIYNLRLFCPIPSHPHCRCVAIPVD